MNVPPNNPWASWVSQSYATVKGEPRLIPIDVPDADPPEWYAAFLEETARESVVIATRDPRTTWQREWDEWQQEKVALQNEHICERVFPRRHEIWC